MSRQPSGSADFHVRIRSAEGARCTLAARGVKWRPCRVRRSGRSRTIAPFPSRRRVSPDASLLESPGWRSGEEQVVHVGLVPPVDPDRVTGLRRRSGSLQGRAEPEFQRRPSLAEEAVKEDGVEGDEQERGRRESGPSRSASVSWRPPGVESRPGRSRRATRAAAGGCRHASRSECRER